MIAYLLKKFPRLSETFVLNEILGQEALGQEVHVFSRRAPDDEPRHPQLAGLRAEVEVLPSIREINPWTALFGSGSDAGSIRGVEELVRLTEGLPMPKFPALLAEAIYLRKRCAELGIEHVHVHFATDAAAVAMMLRALGGPTYSITAHAKDIYRETVEARVLDLLVARSEFTVTVCEANVKHLEGLLGDAAIQRVRRLYNGIDLEAFPFRPDGRDADHVVAVGRLVEKKGFDILLEAVARLRAGGRELRCTLVGDGDQRERLEADVQRLGLGGCVSLVGALPQDEVRAVLARGTVHALPCVVGADGNRDALPTVLLESLASGLPSVSTPVSGVPEILAEGEAGRLVPQRDAEALAHALAALLDDSAERRRIATTGRRHAEWLFDARAIARTLNAWFQQSLRVVA